MKLLNSFAGISRSKGLAAATILLITLVLLFPAIGTAAENSPAPAPDIEQPAGEIQPPVLAEFLQDRSALKNWIAGLKIQRRPNDPPPPQLPRKFRWTGRYVVSDLVDPRTGKMGITVPFVWFGQDGDTQMIAGRPGDPIYFTNYIYNNRLYTYTYAWPKLQWPFLPPFESCDSVGDLSMDDLNAFFASSRYVGPEILQDKQLRKVHHFRLSFVIPSQGRSGAHLRFAVASADLYVEQNDSTKFRQVLHFGYQNLYDPELDEWIIIDKFERGGGEIIFPPCCGRP